MQNDELRLLEGIHNTYRWRSLDATPSTNTACLAAGRQGDAGRLWISARSQSAGKGRRGRPWTSPEGNLYASLMLVNPAEKPSSIGDLPLLAAVALAEALDNATGAYALAALKWPNDLLIGGAKISGILLESEQLGADRTVVVLGFGVNCVSHPDGALYPTTDLAALGYRVGSEALLGVLAKKLDHWLATWDRGGNFASVRSAWLSRAAGIGKPITVRLPDQEIRGLFVDLDKNGHLVLALEGGGERLISAGDVFLSNTR